MASQHNPYAAWERNFVTQVQRLREARGMTQTDLARELQHYGLKFHQQTVQRIEAGERPVRLDEAHLIAKVFDVDLATMTSASAPSEREMRYAVDRVRRRAGDISHDIPEILGDWMEDLGTLVFEVSQRRPRSDGDPLDAATRWGMAWAFKAHTATASLVEAWHHFSELHGVDESELVWTDEALDAIEAWVDAFDDVLGDAEKPSEKLYASLEANDGE